jgi:SHS2 domain-containing protein
VAFRYLEDIALADVAFEATGGSPGELFAEAWSAALGVMVDDPRSLAADCERRVSLTESALDLLLFDFLGRLLYYKDAERLLLRAARVDVARAAGGWSVEALLAGEEIDPLRRSLGVDVKAVTLHRLSVQEAPGGWRAVVVLDV